MLKGSQRPSPLPGPLYSAQSSVVIATECSLKKNKKIKINALSLSSAVLAFMPVCAQRYYFLLLSQFIDVFA